MQMGYHTCHLCSHLQPYASIDQHVYMYHNLFEAMCCDPLRHVKPNGPNLKHIIYLSNHPLGYHGNPSSCMLAFYLSPT